MQKTSILLLFALVIFTLTIQLASAAQRCYTCNSISDCDKSEWRHSTKDCGESGNSCAKLLNGDGETYKRDCYYDSNDKYARISPGCTDLAGKVNRQCICNTYLCNSAVSQTGTFITLAASSIFLILRYFF